MGNLTTMSIGKTDDGIALTRIIIDGKANQAINLMSTNGKLYAFTDAQAEKNIPIRQAIENASNTRPVHVSEKDTPAFIKQFEILTKAALKSTPPKLGTPEEIEAGQKTAEKYGDKARDENRNRPSPKAEYDKRLPLTDKILETLHYTTDTAKNVKNEINQENKNNNQKQINARLTNLLLHPKTAPAAQLFGTLSEHLSALKTKGIAPTSLNAPTDIQALITQAGLLENAQNKIPEHLTQQSFDPHAGLRDAAQHSTPSTTTQAAQK